MKALFMTLHFISDGEVLSTSTLSPTSHAQTHPLVIATPSPTTEVEQLSGSIGNPIFLTFFRHKLIALWFIDVSLFKNYTILLSLNKYNVCTDLKSSIEYLVQCCIVYCKCVYHKNISYQEPTLWLGVLVIPRVTVQ